MRESISVVESDAVWLITHSGTKKHGYLLFDAQNIAELLPSTTAKYYNMAFKFPRGESRLIRKLMVAHGLSEVSNTSSNFNICWGDYLFKDHEYKQFNEWQKINHFPGSAELTQKDTLYNNVNQMQLEYEERDFNFMPISFLLPRDYKIFCDTHSKNPSTWIVKPIDSSMGRGIYVADQVDQVSPDDIQLVSKYLESPLLINGYKFDLRLYVAVTSLDPLVIYLYEEGLVRLAAEKYQKDEELWNPCIHLTNYSVNKFNSNYVKNEEAGKDNHGNKWSLSAFLQHLKSQNIDTVRLMRNVENVITGTILAASTNMRAASEKLLKYPNNCFELYGFDILIDSELKPWLLEVNLTPSLNMSAPIDLKIKSALIADLFSLVGVKVCDPNTENKDQSYSKGKHLKDCHSSSCIKECVAEELRLVHQVCDEYKRRGRWNRIFPAEDSWNLCNGIQEYETHLNLALHKHLYPHMSQIVRYGGNISSRSVSPINLESSDFLQRMACYERSLSCGLDNIYTNKVIHERTMDEKEFLEHTVNSLKAIGNDLLLSKYKAHISFLMYLQGIQQTLMDGFDNEKAVDIAARFLQKSGRMLHKHIHFQIPYKGIPIKSRANILSRQLGDFITHFKKTTFMNLEEDLDTTKTSKKLLSSPDSFLPPIFTIHGISSNTSKQSDSRSLHIDAAGINSRS